MKDKGKDKRLIIPGDAFEEEASEGLGRLSREEAEADLRDLKARMERRLRKPRMIWLPAAAAVVILLVASAVYVSTFRDRSTDLTDLARAEEARGDSLVVAMTEGAKGDTAPGSGAEGGNADTALIAMAIPIHKQEFSSVFRESAAVSGAARGTAESKSARQAVMADRDVTIAVAEPDEEVADERMVAAEKNEVAEAVITEAVEEETVAKRATVNPVEQEAAAEEVIVGALPMVQKAAKKERAAAKDEAAAGAQAPSSIRVTTVDVAPGVAVSAETRPAAPSGGYEEFTKWLQDNVRYPDEIEPRVRQETVVTFKVRTDSTVYDLKAERTAGDLFTQEAFRLLREGPKWQPAIRNGQTVEDTVKVTVIFR